MLVLSLSKDGPGFVDEHDELLLTLLPAHPLGRDVRPVLLGGVDGFF